MDIAGMDKSAGEILSSLEGKSLSVKDRMERMQEGGGF